MSMTDVIMLTKRVEGLIHEQTLTQAVNEPSIEWVFRNSKTIGITLCKAYGIESAPLKACKTWQAIISSKTAMQGLTSSSAAMRVVVISSERTQSIIDSNAAMQAVAASSTAMQVIAESDEIMLAVIKSTTAAQTIIASSTAMQAVAASSTAIQMMFNNSTLLQSIINSSIAMQAVAASSAAMRLIADSESLFKTVISSNVAVTALHGSTTASNAFVSSPMAVNASVTVGTSNVGLASGKVLIFRISSINSSYRPFTLSGTSATPVSTVVADSGTILYCCYICTNPKGKYSSGSDAVTVYYIPLT